MSMASLNKVILKKFHLNNPFKLALKKIAFGLPNDAFKPAALNFHTKHSLSIIITSLVTLGEVNIGWEWFSHKK